MTCRDCVDQARLSHFLVLDHPSTGRVMRTLNTAVALTLLMLSGGNRTPSPAADGRAVDIVGLDYAFQVPTTALAGRTIFHFVNKGKVAHELNISLLKAGASVE